MDNIYGFFKEELLGSVLVFRRRFRFIPEKLNIFLENKLYSLENGFYSLNVRLYSLKTDFIPKPIKKQAQVTLSLLDDSYFSISANTDLATISISSGDKSVDASI